jgi:hypothetical protein
MARYLVEKGAVPLLGEINVEIERQKNKLEYEYGEQIHKMITESPSIWKG